jgi:hypothetical protein
VKSKHESIPNTRGVDPSASLRKRSKEPTGRMPTKLSPLVAKYLSAAS